MVRLVFRPYTQVRRSICTSESLRASTRVSPGFALLRHSSPSFGSRRARSRSAPPPTRPGRAGGAPATPRGDGIPPGPSRGGPRFHCARGFRTTPRLARTPDSLVRVSRRVGRIPDVIATDPRRPPGAPSRRTGAVGGHGCPVPAGRDPRPRLGGLLRGAESPSAPCKPGPIRGEAVTAARRPKAPRRPPSSPGSWPAGSRSWRSAHGKCTRRGSGQRRRGGPEDPLPPPPVPRPG